MGLEWGELEMPVPPRTPESRAGDPAEWAGGGAAVLRAPELWPREAGCANEVVGWVLGLRSWWDVGGLEKLEGGTVSVLIHERHMRTSVRVRVRGCGRVWAGLCVCSEFCEQAGVMEVKLGTPPLHCARGSLGNLRRLH